MLCNKTENPRKSFLQLLARGMNKIKNEHIFEPYDTSLKLSFAPGHGMFHGHPTVQCTISRPPNERAGRFSLSSK